MARSHPGGSLAAKAHPGGSLEAKNHPQGLLVSGTHPAGSLALRTHPEKVGGAGASSDDDFIAACKRLESLYGVWTCSEASTGDAGDDAVIMSDLSGNERPSIKTKIDAGGSWEIKEDNPPSGSIDSLSKYVYTASGKQGTSNYAALASAFDSEPALKPRPFSGFVIFYAPNISGSVVEIMSLTGTRSAPAGVANAFSLFNQTYFLGWKTRLGYTDTGAGISTVIQTNDDRSGNWWYLAFRAIETDDPADDPPSANVVTVYVQQIGSSWGTNQSSFTLTNEGLFANNAVMKTGLRFGYASTGTPAADFRWASFGLFTEDIGVGTSGDTLETIYNGAGFNS